MLRGEARRRRRRRFASRWSGGRRAGRPAAGSMDHVLTGEIDHAVFMTRDNEATSATSRGQAPIQIACRWVARSPSLTEPADQTAC